VNPAEVAARTGQLEDAGGVPVKMSYTGLEGFDFFVRMYVASFTPGMAGLDESGFSPSIPPVLNIYSIEPGTLQWLLSVLYRRLLIRPCRWD
jgi:hypothetical protein